MKGKGDMAALNDATLPEPKMNSAAPDEGNRRGDILRAAGRLFREKGYKGTTIRDIAAAVNMRSGSPFYHFKTKHDMLLAVAVDGIVDIHTAVAAAATSIADPAQRFRAMVHAHLGALLNPEGRDFAAVVLRECGALEPEAYAQVQVHKDAYEQYWATTLDELAAAGLLYGDMKSTRLLLLGALNWAPHWYAPGGRLTPNDIAQQLCTLILPTS
jgi:TetR/AcrR family transcriptional regulator, cholesterol catabolism regulator